MERLEKFDVKQTSSDKTITIFSQSIAEKSEFPFVQCALLMADTKRDIIDELVRLNNSLRKYGKRVRTKICFKLEDLQEEDINESNS